MIDHVNNLKLQHLVELSKLGDGCAALEQGIERWLNEHDVVFAGHTIPFVLMPHFVSPGQLRRVKHAVACLSSVLDRFCDAYADDERLREELAVPPREDALIRLDPGYRRPLRICRLDAFLQGYDVKFLEFNADSPAGIGYTDVLHEGLAQAIDLPRVKAEFETAYTPMLPMLVGTLLDAYGQLRAERPDLPERPRLALVDTEDSPSVPEFRIICAAARESGLEAIHGTLGELEYDGSLLRLGGEPVHLVYRRALLEDCPEGDLVAAARDRSAAIVNPFRARVANNKKLFALLQDPRFAHLVEERERRVIDETIPWTRILKEGRASYGEWVVDLLPFVSDNRERLVLKPASDYGGHGVSLGMETEQAVWDRLIEDHVEEGDFVVQEYVPVPEEMFPTVEDGHVQMRLKRFNINPFGIGGRYAGMITRISDQAVINVSAGGGLLPSVVGRHRQRLLAEEESSDDETAGLRR
ncbi:MAG TPA: glutathionylspermidine synthase family protein [Thermoleophilaceae bacterium]|nr:glutathionylspermidine synthase family protein [Thermoleophilaceae bacterium]